MKSENPEICFGLHLSMDASNRDRVDIVKKLRLPDLERYTSCRESMCLSRDTDQTRGLDNNVYIPQSSRTTMRIGDTILQCVLPSGKSGTFLRRFGRVVRSYTSQNYRQLPCCSEIPLCRERSAELQVWDFFILPWTEQKGERRNVDILVTFA